MTSALLTRANPNALYSYEIKTHWTLLHCTLTKSKYPNILDPLTYTLTKSKYVVLFDLLEVKGQHGAHPQINPRLWGHKSPTVSLTVTGDGNSNNLRRRSITYCWKTRLHLWGLRGHYMLRFPSMLKQGCCNLSILPQYLKSKWTTNDLRSLDIRRHVQYNWMISLSFPR